MALGSPAALLLILVAIKTIIDVKMHVREHKKAGVKTTSKKFDIKIPCI
jgi:hypothetical protein